jgi:tetratricopeptide (TPR) repeat protein
MTGDFNIAVAPFAVEGAPGIATESAFTGLDSSIFDALGDELRVLERSGYDIDLLGPEDVGAVRGQPEIRADKLQRIADQTRADVIISGQIRVEPDQASFIAELHLSDRQLQDASELSGRHELRRFATTSGDATLNSETRRSLRRGILARTRALARFIAGLGLYGSGKFALAMRYFNDAAGEWGGQEGLEVLQIFRANTAGKMKQLTVARQYYDAALRTVPGYGRAVLGKAELAYHEARGTCERGSANRVGLEQALKQYGRAGSATVRPPGADIAVKVAFGVGRTMLCLSQALLGNYWTEAEAQFRRVVDEFERGNRRLRRLAGEAYAGIGFTILPPEGSSNGDATWRRAADAYQRAVELSVDPERKGIFHGMLGHIYTRLHDLERARIEYRRAIRLDRANAGRYRAALRQLVGP